MSHSKHAFIRLALDCNALLFGDFTLKSGRQSPYFFNAGLFYQGHALRELGQYYARVLMREVQDVRHLFGPAYKGLPITTATAIALAEHGIETTVSFNRKETKAHGEGGDLIGAPLNGPTVIIDDVITAGIAFKEAQRFILNKGGSVQAVVIALDRQEHSTGTISTLASIQAEGVPVHAIITLEDLIIYLKEQGDQEQAHRLAKHREQFGI